MSESVPRLFAGKAGNDYHHGGEDYANLMGNFALGAMNLSNWLNGRESLSDSGMSATEWMAAYGDSEFIGHNNAWADFLAAQSDTNKREDGYDRHALGQKTYEELLATDIARDERNKDDWGHVTGPMLAIGHAGKGLYDFGSLVTQWGANWFTGEYPNAAWQLTDTVLRSHLIINLSKIMMQPNCAIARKFSAWNSYLTTRRRKFCSQANSRSTLQRRR